MVARISVRPYVGYPMNRLEEIEKRLDAITPPPWILMPELCGPEGQGVYEDATMGPICEVGDPYPRGSNNPQENMEFIVNAPEDMRWLLETVKESVEVCQDVIPVVELAEELADWLNTYCCSYAGKEYGRKLRKLLDDGKRWG